MVITINGRDYELNFGLQFLKLVNQQYGLSMPVENGMVIPFEAKGSTMMMAKLEVQDFIAVYDLIRFATSTLKVQPKPEDVEKFIEELMMESTVEDNKFRDFVLELEENLKKVPAVAYELMNQ